MFENILSPQMIVNFLKNTADFKKLALNIFESQQMKNFVQEDIGLNYEQLKVNLFNAFTNTSKSNAGKMQEQQIENAQKIQIYRQLANSLIKEEGLSVYSSIILSAGFVGIQQTKVVDFLKSKGYSASKMKIENYYKMNEGFLKSILKKRGKIIPGWNDTITSNDLELEKNENDLSLIEIPEVPVEQQLGISEKLSHE